MSTPAISCLHSDRALLGEGGTWDAAAQVLWWVDIKRGLLNRYSPHDQRNESWQVSEMLSCALPLPGATNQLIVATRRNILAVDVNNKPEPDRLVASIDNFPDNVRFNDAKIDPAGKLWIGTMDNEEREVCGRWLRYDLANGACTEIASNFGVTNGPAFDTVNNFVYLTDSNLRRIYRGTFDRALGCVDLAPWRDFDPEHGYPDGMNFAPDGTLWVAFWDGSCIRQLDLAGEIISEVPLPVQRPTSVAFASPTLAFVTSASIGLAAGGVDGALLSVHWL